MRKFNFIVQNGPSFWEQLSGKQILWLVHGINGEIGNEDLVLNELLGYSQGANQCIPMYSLNWN